MIHRSVQDLTVSIVYCRHPTCFTLSSRKVFCPLVLLLVPQAQLMWYVNVTVYYIVILICAVTVSTGKNLVWVCFF